MTQVRVILLALLVVLSVPVAAISGAAPAQTDQSADRTQQAAQMATPANTTATLSLDSVPASAFQEAEPDISATLDVQQRELDARYTEYALDERFQELESEENRSELLLNVTGQLEARIDALREEERQSRLAYVRGDITAAEYVATLGRIDAEAREIEALLGRFAGEYAYFSQVPAVSDHVVERFEEKLATLQGPVREDVGRALQGEVDGDRVWVGASRNGVVLSTIRGGQYVSEAYRADHFNPDQSDTAVSANTLATRLIQDGLGAELYPWGWNTNHINLRGLEHVVYFQFTHEHGEVTAYVDGTSQEVYREYQTKTLRDIPTTPAVTNRSEDLDFQVAVNQTYAGGPLRVAVTNETGSPKTAEILVGGTYVGTTGTNGVVWTVGGAGTYNVTARRGGESLNVTVRALAPKPVGSVNGTT
ncbi:hypothetical protein ACFQH6_18600 [Halobacteriaceae archaeon GCM10025711]